VSRRRQLAAGLQSVQLGPGSLRPGEVQPAADQPPINFGIWIAQYGLAMPSNAWLPAWQGGTAALPRPAALLLLLLAWRKALVAKRRCLARCTPARGA
jgi:hypothetical protein